MPASSPAACCWSRDGRRLHDAPSVGSQPVTLVTPAHLDCQSRGCSPAWPACSLWQVEAFLRGPDRTRKFRRSNAKTVQRLISKLHVKGHRSGRGSYSAQAKSGQDEQGPFCLLTKTRAWFEQQQRQRATQLAKVLRELQQLREVLPSAPSAGAQQATAAAHP